MPKPGELGEQSDGRVALVTGGARGIGLEIVRRFLVVMTHIAFGDAVGGLNGCAAVLVALIHARTTGRGQFIDLAQIECMLPLAAPWITLHSIDGAPPVKYGNRHPQLVPHGCFRCAGEDN
ncbi:CoA transferase [Bradyrhizobium sp. 160]|uniref:CoA transferase n=1 Tax=Bradyrhizobium sp. 160 TaxID=2782634 RepID=UPI0020981CBB|nr:CoA transferase [Bradyrhizobium sp. 160]